MTRALLDVDADEVVTAVAGPSLIRLPRAILFGAAAIESAPALIAEHGSSALICTDERLGNSPELHALVASLARQGVHSAVYARVEPDLPVANVLDCVATVSKRPDVIVGFGGGSCIDLAKVAAVLLTHGGEVSDYYGERNVPGPVIPVVAVTTTAGTGSEATPVAVVSDPSRAMKVGLSSPYLIPAVAVVDPGLTLSCPPSLTRDAGADAVSHLVEAFTAVRRDAREVVDGRVFVGKSAATDVVAVKGLRLMARSLHEAYQNPSNARARSDVSAAALAGGIALGTAGTAAAHALQYPIGALTATSHGAGVGALLPYVMRLNLPARIDEFAAIADAMGVRTDGLSPEAAAREGVLAVEGLLASIDVPPTIAGLGVAEADLDSIADDAMKATRLVENNPVALDRDVLRRVLAAAHAGRRDFDQHSRARKPATAGTGTEHSHA